MYLEGVGQGSQESPGRDCFSTSFAFPYLLGPFPAARLNITLRLFGHAEVIQAFRSQIGEPRNRTGEVAGRKAT